MDTSYNAIVARRPGDRWGGGGAHIPSKLGLGVISSKGVMVLNG